MVKKIVKLSSKIIKSKKESQDEAILSAHSSSNKTYDFLEHLESIKKRPDTYVGSVVENDIVTKIAIPFKENQTNTEEIPEHTFDEPILVDEKIRLVAGLIQIYGEILGNAIDNSFIGEVENPTTKIWIDVDAKTGTTSIKNNGSGIPVEKHERAQMYIPEMVFCKLISGSHFDDNQKRKSSGRNGYGAKLTNAFSDIFIVETIDKKRLLKFYQRHYDGMTGRDEPIITPIKKGDEEFTKITWIPTFSRFGLSGYNNAHLQKMHMMAYQAGMITQAEIYFNGMKIYIPSLQNYTKLIYPSLNSMSFESDNSDVVLIEKDAEDQDDFQHCCYVNGIQTQEGGVHLDKWSDAIFRPLLDAVNNKITSRSDDIKLTIKDLKMRFILFVKCTLINPSFDSQTKNRLNAPEPEIIPPTTKQIKEILKWPFVEYMTAKVEQKTKILLNGVRSKRGHFRCIPKLTDATAIANSATGKKQSAECSLFLTEGDSAKSFIMKGMSVIEGGSVYNGAMPLRGKILNAKKQSVRKMMQNAEVQNIINAIGLKTDVDYTKDENFATLRYQKRIVIAADQDVDGFHIASLIINFFHQYFPTILKRDFIYLLWTPIIIIQEKRGKYKYFYQISDAEEWMKRQTDAGIKFKKPEYNKGLGGHDKSDILKILKQPRYIRVISSDDTETMKYLNLSFSKATIVDRRKWIDEYFEDHIRHDTSLNDISIKDFINKFLIQFVIHANIRAISGFDGLKDSHRKILTGSLNVNELTVVPQISAAAANKSNYQHGTEALAPTLTKMGSAYAGSNNIPYFFTKGDFGSRLTCDTQYDGAAAPRYLKAKINPIVKYIFRKEDDCILKPVITDNKACEPEMYFPIIPPGLYNGVEGIGDAYAVKIPLYNPNDLIYWIRVWLNNKFSDDKIAFNTLVPWYRGFRGEVEVKGNKIYTKGVMKIVKGIIHITEIPIGVYLDEYEKTLKTMAGFTIEEKKVNGKVVKTVKKTRAKKADEDEPKKRKTPPKLIDGVPLRSGDDENYTFIVTPRDEALTLKSLKLISSLTPNFTVAEPTGKVLSFKTVDDYLNKFCEIRLDAYERRRDVLLNEYKQELLKLTEKHRFIQYFSQKPEIIAGKDDDEIMTTLENEKYIKIDESYKYLLDIDIRNFGKRLLEKLTSQIKEFENKIEYLEKNNAGEIWYDELDELEDVLRTKPWYNDGGIKHRTKTTKKSKARKTKKSEEGAISEVDEISEDGASDE